MKPSDAGQQRSVPSQVFFNLTSPRNLLEKAQKEYEQFCKDPDDWGLFNLLCSVNHIRDWIRWEQSNSEAEQFCDDLWSDPDYTLIRQLCNGVKHFRPKDDDPECATSEGFLAGINKAGDKFNQHNYLVNDKDVRDVIRRVLQQYETFLLTDNAIAPNNI